MILIVDDDPSFLDAARAVLGADEQVFVAANAKQAWKLALHLDFSVMLIDLDLGRENGFVLIEELHSSFPRVAVVAVSGVFSRSTLESAKQFGAVGVLQKPIGPEWVPALADARRRVADRRNEA